MAKYRVEFDNKEVKSIHPAQQDAPEAEAVLEEHTGETLFAVIDAENDEEAKEKADRLALELQTRRTKRELFGDAQDARTDRGPREE